MHFRVICRASDGPYRGFILSRDRITAPNWGAAKQWAHGRCFVLALVHGCHVLYTFTCERTVQ